MKYDKDDWAHRRNMILLFVVVIFCLVAIFVAATGSQ